MVDSIELVSTELIPCRDTNALCEPPRDAGFGLQ